MFLTIPIHLNVLFWASLFVLHAKLFMTISSSLSSLCFYHDLFSSLSIFLEFFISLLERETCWTSSSSPVNTTHELVDFETQNTTVTNTRSNDNFQVYHSDAALFTSLH